MDCISYSGKWTSGVGFAAETGSAVLARTWYKRTRDSEPRLEHEKHIVDVLDSAQNTLKVEVLHMAMKLVEYYW
jgi:hypothetical protein